VAKDASTNQNATSQQITVTYSPVDTQGPSITISSPSDGATVTTSPITVSGTATDSGSGGNGISSVTVNGVSSTGGSATGSGTANWSASVALNQGANTITAVAKDASSAANSTSHSITVTYTPTTAQGTVSAGSASAGIGGTFTIPVTLTLNSGLSATALTLGAQIVPNGSAPVLSGSLGFTSSLTDTPLVNTGGTANALAVVWSSLTTAVTGTKVVGSITGTLPGTSVVGNTYSIQITGASASQGSTVYTLTGGSAGTLSVVQHTYLEGDVAPYTSDTAPSFGDGNLNILDLVQVLFAVNNVPGFRPAACSDRFDAMDLYPADAATTRGGDGVLDIRDLILELFRVNNLDLDRPQRASRNGTCSSSAPVAQLARTLSEADGVFVFGDPQSSDGTALRLPLYLEARRDLSRIALTFALGDQKTHIHFVSAPDALPSLKNDEAVGVVSVAWLSGLNVRAGQRFLLGYLEAPGKTAPDFSLYGLSASDLESNTEVRLAVQGTVRHSR